MVVLNHPEHASCLNQDYRLNADLTNLILLPVHIYKNRWQPKSVKIR